MSKVISQAEYMSAFAGEKRAKAFEHALDIRKFEIDLYWKRATYFWTFIGATLAGYAAVFVASGTFPKTDLLVILSCLGLVFSFAWFCVNRGSKHWQENWENHVDMLEDETIGPLYKTVLTRPDSACVSEYVADIITGPSPLSVSKINQIISLYVTGLWGFLLYKALPPFSCAAPVKWEYVGLVAFALASCIAFLTLGRTYGGSYRLVAKQRKAKELRESG
ncbi:RipA family octameric membrane protein [Methylococcus geothermalis]|uniref:Uncharacterized protein n=1 Tax=Methylococcus geothermalis TaxID=2681310 RepID=A0A858QB93_9GAMM|nr:hypothetical protein [Methylococcus geothermalis]QJD30956.1 hypothetical protein GNH96_14015 [Methylococcus geothermalis]